MILDYDTMNRKHRRTLESVFRKPEPANLNWDDIEKLLKSLGAVVSEREGSRVAILLNGRIAVFHRPHPRKETDKGAVKSVRKFLENSGVRP
jgi:hypothetical protein